MIHWIWTALSTYLLHSEHGNGYQFWSSGPGPGLGQVAIVGAILAHIKHRNCHHRGCWRTWPFVHLHPQHGWPACKEHWNDHPEHIGATTTTEGC